MGQEFGNCKDQGGNAMSKPKAIFCWSGGKDSSLALYRVLSEYDIVSLLTTVNSEFERISMHGVRKELLETQAAAIELPLDIVYLGNPCCNEDYERLMEEKMLAYKEAGVSEVIFGDIFLQDLREYRESRLAKINMTATFPLWMEPTDRLISEFLELKFESVTCCVSDAWLGENMVGRVIDREFLNELPADVDPCGENGEFHSFTFDGPIFRRPVEFDIGEKVYRPITTPNQTCPIDSSHPVPRRQAKGFWYCDFKVPEINTN